MNNIPVPFALIILGVSASVLTFFPSPYLPYPFSAFPNHHCFQIERQIYRQIDGQKDGYIDRQLNRYRQKDSLSIHLFHFPLLAKPFQIIIVTRYIDRQIDTDRKLSSLSFFNLSKLFLFLDRKINMKKDRQMDTYSQKVLQIEVFMRPI